MSAPAHLEAGTSASGVSLSRPPDNVDEGAQPKLSLRPRLVEGHEEALQAADVFFGGFCIFMLVVAGVGWQQGVIPGAAPLAIFAFLVVNVVISQVSLRSQRPYHVEVARIVAGGVIVPVAYLMVPEPLGPWWPGALINGLGGAIVLGLLTQNPFWGRILTVYYIGILALCRVWGLPEASWYDFAVQAGVVAMVGLMFAQIMSLLGRTLARESEKTRALKAARDALFAEMEVAQKIQTLLVPREPEVQASSVVGRMLPADEVGGDYYDVLHTQSGRTLLAIGDVSGHGVTSGLTMMMARASLMGAVEALPEGSLPEIYEVLNRCMCQNLQRMDRNLYMTFALLEHEGKGQFRAVGRHLPIYIYRAESGEVEELDLDGAWLGVLPELDKDQLPEKRFCLQKGDVMVLYTDGVVEHFDDAGEDMFGFDRLKLAVGRYAREGVDAVLDGVLGELNSHQVNHEDDITMLVVRHDGEVLNTTDRAA